jgi:hypothetical protein
MSDFDLTVNNSLGQSIPFKWEKTSDQQIQITVQGLMSGVYFLKLNHQTHKLMVH